MAATVSVRRAIVSKMDIHGDAPPEEDTDIGLVKNVIIYMAEPLLYRNIKEDAI